MSDCTDKEIKPREVWRVVYEKGLLQAESVFVLATDGKDAVLRFLEVYPDDRIEIKEMKRIIAFVEY